MTDTMTTTRALAISPEEIRALRSACGDSVLAFSIRLRLTNEQTVRSWEEGRYRPNPTNAARLLELRDRLAASGHPM